MHLKQKSNSLRFKYSSNDMNKLYLIDVFHNLSYTDVRVVGTNRHHKGCREIIKLALAQIFAFRLYSRRQLQVWHPGKSVRFR